MRSKEDDNDIRAEDSVETSREHGFILHHSLLDAKYLHEGIKIHLQT
jgi:hypothetical protein